MYAYCSIPFAPVRKQPSHLTEQVSQLVYGEWVHILDYGEDWSEVKTEHGYVGFVRTRQILSNPFPRIEKLSVTTTSVETKTSSGERFLLPEGSILTYPTPVQQIKPDKNVVKEITNPPPFSPYDLAIASYGLVNTPYVWGGKTISGFDCSGLVQFLFHKQGFTFPRDAWQQALIGDRIETIPDEYPYLKGDLLFFQHPDKPIHHVAISLGFDVFMHASEWVQINSIDPKSNLYAPERKKTLAFATRIRNADLTPLIESFRRLMA